MIMKDKDLEKTKPIKVLSDFYADNNSDEIDVLDEKSRALKYKDALIKDERKIEEENAEEALAEKNIAMAEALLDEEKEKKNKEEVILKDDVKENKKEVKTSLVSYIKAKWNSLNKNQRIMFIIGMIIILALIIGGVFFLVVKSNKKPEEVVPPVIKEEAPVVADNYYYKEGKLYFLDNSDKEVGTYECENKDADLCYVANNKYRDSFDVPKLLDAYEEEKVKRLPIYGDKYAFLVDDKDEKSKNIKLYSIKDEKVTTTYSDVKAYDDNYVIVATTDKKYGLLKIDEEVKEVIKPQYTYLGMIDGEDNLVAKNKKGYVIINKKNKVLSSSFSSNYEIKSYSNNLVVVKVNEEYSVYDYKNSLISGGYDFASVKGKYMALVNDKELYIADINKVKYNEGDIKLLNRDYVKTYVYDEEGNLASTKRSFEWNVKENFVEVVLYDGLEEPSYKNVEFVYGLINSRYQFVNYFNDKLYFYKDENKEELLGTYACVNKNLVEKSTDNYESCFVASDTIYEDNDMMSASDIKRKSLSPLINDTFVFVHDGDNMVKLVNLAESKIMSTYSSVNTYTPNNDYKFTKYDGKLNVVALNKKGKYGMLTIDGSDVSAKYSFEYNALEKLGNYYVMSSLENSYKVLFNGGRETASMPGKIKGYNSDTKYFKVYSDGKYSVYDYNGDLILDDTFKYVELYNDYFAGVTSNMEVYLYDYQGNQLTLEGVKIGEYPFSKTDNPAFKVKKSDNGYIISVYDGKEYKEFSVSKGEPSLES